MVSTIDDDGGPGQGTPPSSVASMAELMRLGEDLLAAAMATRRSEAVLVRAQAAHLAWLSEKDRALQCGFSSVMSLALEIVGLRPRTTRERLALHRLCAREPAVEEAFLKGRLSACQALAAAPLLDRKDPPDGAVERWISVASAQSVRSLRYEVRRLRAERTARGTAGLGANADVESSTADRRNRDGTTPREAVASVCVDASDETQGRMVTITGPLGFQVVFDRMMELARMVLGFDAPESMCIDAILMETGARGIASEEELGAVPGADPESGVARDAAVGFEPEVGRQPGIESEEGVGSGDGTAPVLKPPPGIRVRPRKTVTARPEAIAHARETLEQVKQFIADVEGLIETGPPSTPHQALDALRQIHLLRAPQRVLFAHLIRDLRRTGVVDLLGYRTMADLVEDRLGLCERSARNRVAESILLEGDSGIEEAYGRGEISLMQAHLIRRLARFGKLRPFVERAREVTWRQLQREYRLLELMKKCDLGTVTRNPLPQARVEEALIAALGGDREEIEQALREQGIRPVPVESSTDPAENPVLMERLEALVEMLALRRWDYLPADEARDRQMSAALRREVKVRFWAPTSIADDFEEVLRRIRTMDGRRLPYWAAAVFMFAEATEVWRREDPQRRPARAKILRRDGYRCVIPGCWNRDHLESSHNRARSLGGTNDEANQSTVCHRHHHHGIHKGYVRITGKAPDSLRFELGCRRDGPPLMILQGNRIVKGAFDGETLA